jgi:hypothetical protein
MGWYHVHQSNTFKPAKPIADKFAARLLHVIRYIDRQASQPMSAKKVAALRNKPATLRAAADACLSSPRCENTPTPAVRTRP